MTNYLDSLKVAFDEDQHVDQPGSFHLYIENKCVTLPSELQHRQTVASAADFLTSLNDIFEVNMRDATGRAAMIKTALAQIVGFLILAAAKETVSQTDWLEAESSAEHLQFAKAIDQLAGFRVKRDLRRKSPDIDLNIQWDEDFLRVPSLVWSISDHADSAASLVHTLISVHTEKWQAQTLDWEQSKLEKVRELAIGEIVTNAFLTPSELEDSSSNTLSS